MTWSSRTVRLTSATITIRPSTHSSMELRSPVANPTDWGAGFERPRVDYSGIRPHPADEIVERLAWLMDNSIPLPGGFRIGLDPILGLVPGLGDVIGAMVSG